MLFSSPLWLLENVLINEFSASFEGGLDEIPLMAIPEKFTNFFSGELVIISGTVFQCVFGSGFII